MRKKFLLAGLAAVAVLFLLVSGWIVFALVDLPDVSTLKRYRPAIASEVLDRNGVVITHYYDRTFRIWAPIASIPEGVIRSVVTAEDDTFFGHEGVNYRAVWDALRHDVRKKRFARGGSTITQQMIKNVLLSKEKTLRRKVREFVLARRAEDILTKRQILEIYLNEVEWGDRIHGVEAASRFYFDKHVQELTTAEAALLAGMLPNPKYYDPFKRPDKARQRQEQVLFNLFQAKLVNEQEYQAALQEPLKLRDPASTRFAMASPANGEHPCHLRALEQTLSEMYGDQALLRKGLHIRTTLDKQLLDGFVAAVGDDRSTPGSLLVLKEGVDVRAIACGGSEEQARLFLSSLGAPSPGYELTSIPLDNLVREHVVAAELEK